MERPSSSAAKSLSHRNFSTKKCPYCSTHLGLNERVCFACKHKVGSVNQDGIAKKPFHWKAYLASLIAWGALIAFLWWAFF